MEIHWLSFGRATYNDGFALHMDAMTGHMLRCYFDKIT